MRVPNFRWQTGLPLPRVSLTASLRPGTRAAPDAWIQLGSAGQAGQLKGLLTQQLLPRH